MASGVADADVDPDDLLADPPEFVIWHEDQITDELAKYWYQRYRLFSKFDMGVWMDEEGWYSVTPELVAQHIAKRCRCATIVDAFCGVGGNAIQMAKYCKKVIAIEINENRLACARHNAKVYGVEDRIEFILGDYMEIARSGKLKADVIFMSPPWGGPSYLAEEKYDIATMIPMGGIKLFNLSRSITRNIAYYLPRNCDYKDLAALASPGEICEVQQNKFRGRVKSLTAFYGDLADSNTASPPGSEPSHQEQQQQAQEAPPIDLESAEALPHDLSH